MTLPTRLGPRRLAGHISAAVRLAFAASPGTATAYAALAVAAGAGPVAGAWLLRVVLDRLSAPRGGDLDDLAPVVLALAAVGILVGVLPALRGFLRGRLLRAVGLAAMDRLYQAMNRITGIGRMEEPAFRDQLRMAHQSGRAGPGQLVDDALAGIASALTLAGFLGALIGINPWMALTVVAATGPGLIAQLRLSRVRASMLWRISPRARREAYYADLLSSLPAAKELRLLRLGDLFRMRMLDEMAESNAAQSRQDGRELRAHSALAALAALIAGGGLLWSIAEAVRGRLSIGDISMFVAAVAGVQTSVQALVERISSAHHATLQFHHYRSVEAAPPDLSTPAAPLGVGPLRTGIELSDVWFRYGPDKPWVLRGVNLHIPHGRTVALVGLNGAGKSTLIKLLCRFYDPSLGTIRWDGRDLRELCVGELRDRIGAVFQDYLGYDLSAAENVGIGDVASIDDRSRIVAAAQRAGAHDVLAGLPHGYETMLSNTYFDEADRDNPQTGVLLSGGQWQRVALARAFLRDQRDLMILDEPSAGLDAQAEHDLHTRLRGHRHGRTSVLISHRLGTVRDADLIVVLADGKVTERGTHDELLARDGGYARLFRLQATGYAEHPAPAMAPAGDPR